MKKLWTAWPWRVFPAGTKATPVRPGLSFLVDRTGASAAMATSTVAGELIISLNTFSVVRRLAGVGRARGLKSSTLSAVLGMVAISTDAGNAKAMPP